MGWSNEVSHEKHRRTALPMFEMASSRAFAGTKPSQTSCLGIFVEFVKIRGKNSLLLSVFSFSKVISCRRAIAELAYGKQ